jgi:hypothetical protein
VRQGHEAAEPGTAHYEQHVLGEEGGAGESVEVEQEEFQRAIRMLAPAIPRAEQPMELGRMVMEGGLQADLVAEVERGRVLRLVPRGEDSPLEASSREEMKRRYLGMCQQEYGGGDCLGLLADGPVLTREDLRTLGLGLALRRVLRETRQALGEMVSPQAVVATIVCTAGVYLALWLLPEPATKVVAAGVTLALLAWLPVHTVWSLLDGWAQLVREVDGATSYEQIEQASGRFSRVLGENTARVLVMLVSAALGGGGAQWASKLPKLPGFSRAVARAEAQGVKLAEAGQVEAVAAGEGRTFTLTVSRPGGRVTAAADEAAEASTGLKTIIRHVGGNRQVFIRGQRWHVPAHRSIGEIPAKDLVGDQLQAMAQRVAKDWSSSKLSARQLDAIGEARAKGRFLEAHLMERRFRGQWVENMLRDQFRALQWNRTGVDVVDPSTGLRYEILSGTASNMERHGRRMADEFFRLIVF